MERPTKDEYYLQLAVDVARRGTCLRRVYGAVIVNNDKVVSTGYNGAPRGKTNCSDLGECFRQEQNIPSGERYELCRSVHAEQNAIIHATYTEMQGATLYLAGIEVETGKLVESPDCCMMCKRMIINAGIKRVVFLHADGSYHSKFPDQDWIVDEDPVERSRVETEVARNTNKPVDEAIGKGGWCGSSGSCQMMA